MSYKFNPFTANFDYYETQMINSNIIYVATTGSDSNDGLTWGSPKLTATAAILALPASGGLIKIGAGGLSVTSSSRTDTVSYSGAGNVFNDASAASGDVGKYVLWGNLGRVPKIISVVPGVSFTVDVLPLTTAATTAKIVRPGLVVPEGVYLEGIGSNYNQQLTSGSATAQTCTQIRDDGTGVTVLIQGANSPAGSSTRYGLSRMSIIGNSGNTYGLFVGNGAWLIRSEDLEISNHGVAGIGLDGNINSHDFRNTVLYGNGSILAATPTGGVITHPFNAAGSASCNFYNPFFSANIGFGICDGVDAGGSYGVNLWAPQFNSQQASAMANSGTSMVLQSKGAGDGMAIVVGGWSETAALYDVITTGFVTIVGMRMHSSHAYHWIVNGGTANAVGCTFEGAGTATAQLNSSGIFTWSAIKSVDPVLYSGAPVTIPSVGSSSTIYANALAAKGATVDGNLVLEDASTPTKSYRFRTSGASLDFDFAGAQIYFSGYPNADFSGTQQFYFAADTSGNLDAFGVWRFHTAPFASTIVTIDPGSTTPLSVAGVVGLRAGTSSAYAKAGGTIADHYSDVGNSTTSETDLYTDTLVASTFGADGDKVSAEYGGIFVSSASATRQIRAYFGGTLIFDSGALSISAGSDAWDVKVLVIRVSASAVRCVVTMSTTGAATNAYCTYTTVTGLTLSNTQILKVTGTAAGVGAATNDIVAKLSTVTWAPAA